jgi:hypothetical protein
MIYEFALSSHKTKHVPIYREPKYRSRVIFAVLRCPERALTGVCQILRNEVKLSYERSVR